MSETAARYDRWKAPAEDGQPLIWPAPADLLRDTLDNQSRMGSAIAALVQNVPLSQVRQSLRRWLGHADDARPLVATGHQTELHHPGVWVKNALIDTAARKLQGRAIHFAVDTDAPKHLHLRWPGGSIAVTDVDQPRAEWSGLVPPPSAAHLQNVATALDGAASAWNFTPMAGQFLQSMRQLAPLAANLPAALTQSVHELDESLGLRHEALLVSPMCWAEPYLVFVHHILARADAFSADYNAALDEFRRENKIRTAGRPMPNLTCLPDGCEVPFWLDDLAAGTRSRAAVSRDADGFALRLPNGEQFHFNPAADGWHAAAQLMQFLRQHNARLAPRALTLTAVLRLLAADQFVHGIGGGQYDQVLDKLIARHFKLDPPRFSVTTATLYFPGAVGESRLCMPCVVQEGHHLKHEVLGREKRILVAAIAAAPRHSAERSSLFYELHDKLSAARNLPQYRQWQEELERTGERRRAEKVLFDRELFYAIQPVGRLEEMIEKYQTAFT